VIGRGWTPGAVVLMAIVVLDACGGSGHALPVQARPSPVAPLHGAVPARVAVVVMENKEYDEVIGSRSAPFINGLARRYALARGMYAATHPSLPNYLALTGGSTFGIDSDCTGCNINAGSNLPTQLSAARLSWKAYMEDLPHPCFTGAGAGGYAKKHDPFIYYDDVRDSPRLCARIVPLTQLASDERSSRLPAFIWITPNLCHDMHDCAVSTGDRFLSSLVPPLLRALGPGGLVFLTWDEGSSNAGCCRLASGGHVATIVAGPGARRSSQLATPTDHYSLLQTIEDILGLRRLKNAACTCTSSLKPLLQASPVPGPGATLAPSPWKGQRVQGERLIARAPVVDRT
jgi:phosphatidylinositol-3-phosphatase